jgi:hypothetical protein
MTSPVGQKGSATLTGVPETIGVPENTQQAGIKAKDSKTPHHSTTQVMQGFRVLLKIPYH